MISGYCPDTIGYRPKTEHQKDAGNSWEGLKTERSDKRKRKDFPHENNCKKTGLCVSCGICADGDEFGDRGGLSGKAEVSQTLIYASSVDGWRAAISACTETTGFPYSRSGYDPPGPKIGLIHPQIARIAFQRANLCSPM